MLLFVEESGLRERHRCLIIPLFWVVLLTLLVASLLLRFSCLAVPERPFLNQLCKLRVLLCTVCEDL